MARTKKSQINKIVFIDTHIVLWLYDKKLTLIPLYVQEVLKNSPLYYAPIIALELQYLFEIGRILVSPHAILEELSETITLTPSDTPFQTVIQYAIQNTWTRDPFDRIIVAYAQAHSATLVTADKVMQKYYKRAMM